MDPLSVTLAVITLATTIKDVVELGQKIREAFAKGNMQVPNNLHNARRVAEDIKEMVEEIKGFIEDHKDALDDTKDFRQALQGLLANSKFRSFETSILPLLPQIGGRRRDRFLRYWYAWGNNNKIERSILNLQSDIVKVMRRYILKSAMRTELKLDTIHQETRRGLTGITQGLEVLEAVQRGVSAIRITEAVTTTTRTNGSSQSSWSTSDEFNRHVITFAQTAPSTSGPMLRTPDVITEELMTVAYIRLQLNSTVKMLEKMSKVPAPTTNSIPQFQMIPFLKQASMGITHLRHDVVRHVICIRDLLDTESMQMVSIYAGAREVHILSTGLGKLGMSHESILVGEWAIKLARKLVDVSGRDSPDCSAVLALYLLNQSRQYHVRGGRIQSLQAIDEAYTITRNLRNQHGGQVHFQILYSEVLMQYANLVDTARSIKFSVEAVQILEDILNVQVLTQSKPQDKIKSMVQPSSSFFDHLFSSANPITAITSYARALQQLGTSLAIDGHPGSALDLQLLVIAVHRQMVSIHGHEHKVELAWALSSLVQRSLPITASCITREQLVALAEECIQLLRELADKSRLTYARELVHVLWAKASTLGSLGRDAEAITTWEEVTSLAGQIVQDSELCAAALDNLSNQFRRLERHEDAARTVMLAITTYHEDSEHRAWRYFHLSKDLQQLRHHEESVEAARRSVALHRNLAMRVPGACTSNLTKSLANLAHCLATLGEYSEALITWKESVSMLDNFLYTNTDTNSNSAAIDSYLAALDMHIWISYVLEDEEECLIVGFTAVQYLRQMSELYPQNADTVLDLMWAEFRYAYNLLRVGSLQDGQQYIDHWFAIRNKKLEATPEPEIDRWRAVMMNLKAGVLDNQGSTKQALLATRKVRDIVRLSFSTSQPSFEGLIESMIQESQLRVNLGDSDGALSVAEEALQLSRDNKLEPIVDSLVWSLYGVAFTALSCRNYGRAFEAAQEGCDTYARPENLKRWQNNEYGEQDMFIRPILFAILSSAEANLGKRRTALEYAHHAVNASLEIRDMKSRISATAAERSYMETRGNMADILVATGDLPQARQICEERRTYFSKRVEKRMGDYRELAPILRMLGVLCCSEERHEEGNAAAKELSRIVRMLGSAFPSLQEQVKIRLRGQAKVPILEVLSSMGEKLECGHQVEVVSLFEI